MSTHTLAHAERAQRDDSRYADLAEALRDLDDVDAVAVEHERLPPRLLVTLATANVTPAVEDRLSDFAAVVEPGSVEVTGTGTLRFAVTTPEGFKPAGTRDARRYGESSVSLTFTRESLELSGFEVGDSLDVKARAGAILLTGHGR